MPKKGRRTNVRQQVRSAGQRSVEFEQGQRRVSTPRGRNTTLTLAPRVQQSATDRLSIYAQRTGQQVSQALQRDRMDAFYQANLDRQEREDRERQEEALRQQELTLRRQESARARRERARAEVRDIRGRQAQREAEEKRVMGERLGRAQARVEAVRLRRQQTALAEQQRQQQQVIADQQRRQQEQLAQQQRQQQSQIAQADLEQRREGGRQAIQIARQQAEGLKEKIRSKERIAQQQLALQERGMARQDRLIQDHFTAMRGMFLNAQASQERRIGELENTMRRGIQAIQDRTGQDSIDITYLNDAVGRELDHEGLRPPQPQLTLQRADTTDSEASELARTISGVDTQRHRPPVFRSPTAPPPKTTSTEFREARAEMKKTLTGDDIPALARAYNRELELEAGSSRRRRALAIDRRLQFLQEDPTPTPQQLARRTAFLQEGSASPLALEPEPEGQELERTETASTTPFIDSSDEEPTLTPEQLAEKIGFERAREEARGGRKAYPIPERFKTKTERDRYIIGVFRGEERQPEPQPELSLEEDTSNPFSPSVAPTLGAVAEGVGSTLRTGAGLIGGLATGLGEAVYESLPSARDIGKATGEAVISGGATALQTARGLVEDVVSSTDEEEQGAGTGLLENVNPLEELGAGKYATGSDKKGWESKLGFTITDTSGAIGKRTKGTEYFLMKKDAKNYSIVDKTNPKLTKWNNVKIPRMNELITRGFVAVS